VSYSPSEVPVALHWVYRPNSNTGAPVRISESRDRYILSSNSFTGSTTGRLQVIGLVDQDGGRYSCQAVFSNGSRAMESQELQLFTRGVFSNSGLQPCSSLSGESESISLCALSGQVTDNGNGDPQTPPPDNGGAGVGGGGGGGAFGADTGIIFAGIGIGVFILVTGFILALCCVLFQCCKYFD